MKNQNVKYVNGEEIRGVKEVAELKKCIVNNTYSSYITINQVIVIYNKVKNKLSKNEISYILNLNTDNIYVIRENIKLIYLKVDIDIITYINNCKIAPIEYMLVYKASKYNISDIKTFIRYEYDKKYTIVSALENNIPIKIIEGVIDKPYKQIREYSKEYLAKGHIRVTPSNTAYEKINNETILKISEIIKNKNTDITYESLRKIVDIDIDDYHLFKDTIIKSNHYEIHNILKDPNIRTISFYRELCKAINSGVSYTRISIIILSKNTAIMEVLRRASKSNIPTNIIRKASMFMDYNEVVTLLNLAKQEGVCHKKLLNIPVTIKYNCFKSYI